MRRLSIPLTVWWLVSISRASGQSAYQIVIDTSSIAGQQGKIAFDLTSNRLRTNRADLVNFSTDGKLSLPETQGGLVSGDLIAGRMPAPFTRIGGNQFFNELLLNFERFGERISFSINVSESSPGESVPDQFALYLLDSEGRSLARGRHAGGRGNPNFTLTITGERGGDLAIYGRTIDKGRRGKIHADDPEREALVDFTITPIWISVEEEDKLPVTAIEGDLQEFCTKRCNDNPEECTATEFGVSVSDDVFLRFDDLGNLKARVALIEALKPDSTVRVRVTGRVLTKTTVLVREIQIL